jgi:hypothetical protein
MLNHRGTESTELVFFLPDRETAIGQKSATLLVSFLAVNIVGQSQPCTTRLPVAEAQMFFPGRRLPAREKSYILCVLCASVVQSNLPNALCAMRYLS